METFSRETLHPWFVTGFADGHGSFTFSRSSKQLSLYFAIKLTTTDRSTLEAIQGFFGGIGRIYEVGSSAVLFRVTRIAELVQVVAHFDAYPLHTHKHDVYRVWRDMVGLKRNFRGATRASLESLANELSARTSRTP